MENKLVSGGRLLTLAASGEDNWVDITEKAHIELGNYVTLEDVTVRDIFTLIKGSPILRAILVPDFIEDFLAHMEKFPDPVIVPRKVDEPNIEYLEICHNAEYDKFRNSVCLCEVPYLHGMSEIVTPEMANEHYPVGRRVGFAIEFRKFEELLDLPVRFNGHTTLEQSSLYSVGCDNYKAKVVDIPVIKLLDAIRAVTFEVSFLGSPSDVDAERESLEHIVGQVNELKEAVASGKSIEEIFVGDKGIVEHNSLSLDEIFGSSVISGVVVFDEAVDTLCLPGILDNLPDYVIVDKFLKKHFGDKVKVKDGFEGLCAYGYRYVVVNEGKRNFEAVDEKMLKKVKEGLGLAGHNWKTIYPDTLTNLRHFGVDVDVTYFDDLY